MVLDTIGGVGMGMFDALNSLRKAIESSGDKLQKASLALGKTFDQTNAEITPAMEGLQGSLDQRLGASMAGLQAGLQGNTAGVAKLINQQQLTGTAFGNTANAMAALSQTLNISNEDINGLSTRLLETAGTYSVSTDKLVNAVDALKDTFPTQQLAGMGVQVTEAMAGLTARMPAMAGQVASVMKMILDPSLKTEANLARLGIAGVRERLAGAKDAKAAESILVSAIRTAGGNITDFVSGDFFASIGIATNVFGENAAAMAAINAQLDKRIRNEEATTGFGDTIETIKANILVPLQRILQLDFYPAIKDISFVLAGIGERFAGALAKWIGKLDISEKGINTFTDSIVNGVGKLAMGLQDVVNFFIDLANTTLPKMKAAFGSFLLFADKYTPGVDLITPDMVGMSEADKFSMSHTWVQRQRYPELDRNYDEAHRKFEELKATMGVAVMGTTGHATFGQTAVDMLAGLRSDSTTGLGYQRRIAEATEAVNDKTLDPFGDTADSYLSNTAMQMQNIMGAILGQTQQEMMEETNAILMSMLHTGGGTALNGSYSTPNNF